MLLTEITAALKAEHDSAESHHTCLSDALQAAVTLEFATIPPYLCALWSIKDELHPVAKSIREIVQEEMLHMALAANMLTAIGGRPMIADGLPSYPGGLPMGVHQGLIVSLSGLTRESLDVFMQIERPAVIVAHDDEPASPAGAADETIGEFYDSIKESFRVLNPPLSVEHQLAGPLAWSILRNYEDVERAIELIKRQGEGSSASPTDTGKDDLAHFYRFEEIMIGKKLQWDEDKQAFVHGAAIEWPEVWPMGVVPEGGYRQADVSAEVWHLLNTFDGVYTKLVNYLQDTWRRGGQAAFVHAIETMFALQKSALALMQIPIVGDENGQTYGPCFRHKG